MVTSSQNAQPPELKTLKQRRIDPNKQLLSHAPNKNKNKIQQRRSGYILNGNSPISRSCSFIRETSEQSDEASTKALNKEND